MRSFFSRRAFFAAASSSSSHLARSPAALLPAFPPPPPPSSPSHIHPIPAPSTVAAAAAAIFSPRRSFNGAPQEPLPTDLAVGLPLEPWGTEEEAAAVEEEEDEDGPMNEFLSRFTWTMRQKLAEAFPDSNRETLDGMLLVVAQVVVAEMEKGGGVLPAGGLSDPSIDLSPDLWRTVWEVSRSAFEETQRARRRQEMRGFLHCDEVKEMCRFASEMGIRGDMLRELRFKWAREKMEESEFYKNLERIREEHRRAEELAKREGVAAAGLVGEGDEAAEVAERPTLTTLPQRKGKLKYKIHGLDFSGQKWAEVADKIHEAEKRIAAKEPQPIMGECKLVTEEILSMKEDDDPAPLLAKWVEFLGPKRADWLALLDRIHERNPTVYFKIAELVLNEESFQTAIGDYSKLMDAYAKVNHVEDAERIYQKMTEKGIDADIRVLVILLQMYCEAGILDRAKEAFESLRSRGFQPDLKTYKSIIVAYVNAGLPRAAETLIREMEVRDIKPTLEMYMVLLQAFAQRGVVDSAQRLFNNMQFSGIQPNLEACTLLLEAYEHAGDPDQARHSFDFILKAGHKPDDRCVSSMIATYEKNNLLDKALDLLLNIEKDGFKPGIATYTVLVDWLGKLLLVDEVEQLLDKIAELGDYPFHINVSLCDMYARAGVKNKAVRFLKRVEGKKELLSAEQFERVIHGLIAGGFVEDAKRVLDAMQARGFSPSESVRRALTNVVIRQRPTTSR